MLRIQVTLLFASFQKFIYLQIYRTFISEASNLIETDHNVIWSKLLMQQPRRIQKSPVYIEKWKKDCKVKICCKEIQRRITVQTPLNHGFLKKWRTLGRINNRKVPNIQKLPRPPTTCRIHTNEKWSSQELKLSKVEKWSFGKRCWGNSQNTASTATILEMPIKEKLKKMNRKPPGQNTKQTLKIRWPGAYNKTNF